MDKRMLRQAQELQAKLAKAQEELGSVTVEASSGGGVVTVVANGHQNIQSIKISPEAVDPEDLGLLEDLVLAAVNDALDKSQRMAQDRLGGLTGNLKIPGM